MFGKISKTGVVMTLPILFFVPVFAHAAELPNDGSVNIDVDRIQTDTGDAEQEQQTYMEEQGIEVFQEENTEKIEEGQEQEDLERQEVVDNLFKSEEVATTDETELPDEMFVDYSPEYATVESEELSDDSNVYLGVLVGAVLLLVSSLFFFRKSFE